MGYLSKAARITDNDHYCSFKLAVITTATATNEVTSVLEGYSSLSDSVQQGVQ